MTVQHHPIDQHQGEALLLDYASGALGESWSLAIATHLALCPSCRRELADIEALGGALLESAAPEPVKASALESVLARLDGPDGTPEPAPIQAPAVGGSVPILPQPLRGYVGGDVDALAWKRLAPGAYHLPIKTGDDGALARLLRIPAGKPVPHHGHRGLELTLVLCGAFSDETGLYARGDLQVADEGLEHQPFAEPGDDCICLAITDAPLRFRSLAARIAQPLIGI